MLTPLASSSSNRNDKEKAAAATTIAEELRLAKETARLAKEKYESMRKRLEHSAREIKSLREQRDRATLISKQMSAETSRLREECRDLQRRVALLESNTCDVSI